MMAFRCPACLCRSLALSLSFRRVFGHLPRLALRPQAGDGQSRAATADSEGLVDKVSQQCAPPQKKLSPPGETHRVQPPGREEPVGPRGVVQLSSPHFGRGVLFRMAGGHWDSVAGRSPGALSRGFQMWWRGHEPLVLPPRAQSHWRNGKGTGRGTRWALTLCGDQLCFEKCQVFVFFSLGDRFTCLPTVLFSRNFSEKSQPLPGLNGGAGGRSPSGG